MTSRVTKGEGWLEERGDPVPADLIVHLQINLIIQHEESGVCLISLFTELHKRATKAHQLQPDCAVCQKDSWVLGFDCSSWQ